MCARGPVWDRPLQKRTSSIIFAVGAGVLTRPLWRWAPFVGCGLPDAPFHLHAKRRRGGPRGRPCRILNQVSLPFVGAAISRPSLPPGGRLNGETPGGSLQAEKRAGVHLPFGKAQFSAYTFSHFWLATVQEVLQADWQEVWHSPQPPLAALAFRVAPLRV